VRILPLKGFARRKIESALIRLAAWILIGRNVHRCGVVSRRDNNDMYHMAEKLEDIAERIASQYP
jgi:hypothetical protein